MTAQKKSEPLAVWALVKAAAPYVMTVLSVVAVGGFTVGATIQELRSYHREAESRNDAQDDTLADHEKRIRVNTAHVLAEQD